MKYSQSPLSEMQFSVGIRLVRYDEQYRSKREIFKLYRIVCIGQPSGGGVAHPYVRSDARDERKIENLQPTHCLIW